MNYQNYIALKEESKEDSKAKVMVKKYKMKICPTPKLYLTVTEEIPKYLEDAKYLSKNVFEKVILTSYPRSGNTLLRKYLEDITGVRVNYTISTQN